MKKIFYFFIIAFLILYGITANAAWSNDPTINTSICTNTYDQQNPKIVTTSDGNFIIVWQDKRFGNWDIYAQKLNSSGQIIWALDGLSVCSAAGDQTFLQIVSDGSGGVIIVWHDNREGVGDIYAQRINSAGTVEWTTDGIAICSANSNQELPQLTSDGSGGAIITWQDRRNGSNSDIYAQRINSSGTPQWIANGVAICTETTKNQDFPQIINDGSGGAIITWRDCYKDDDWVYDDIYAQKINSAGVVQWIANGVVVCNASYRQDSPQLVSDGSGGAIITWNDGRAPLDCNIYAQRINSTGTTEWTGNGVAICAAVYDQTFPQLLSDGSGGAIITWTDPRNNVSGIDIYAQRINSTGGVEWTSDGVGICTATEQQGYPEIISDGSGGAIITWQDLRNDSGDWNIYAQKINSSGELQWTSDGVAISTASQLQYHPQIATDGSGGAVITWYDYRSGSNNDIYAQNICYSGNLGTCSNEIYYVKWDASGANNGTSWTDAFLSFKSALNIATSGDQIWVARGTYMPSYNYGLVGGLRFNHFRMKKGVAIYGGFFGNETNISQRANYGYGETNEVILSGDLDGNDNYSTMPPTNISDNCYHLFYHPEGLGLDNSTILDGFIIKGANADGPGPDFYHGGGMYNDNNNPKLINCRFVYNVAGGSGGMINFKSSPTLKKCDFINNYSQLSCGGMCNGDRSSPTLNDCNFTGNQGSYGGGMENYNNSSPTLTNCYFNNNKFVDPGFPYTPKSGGMYNYNKCSPILTNCKFQNNGGKSGGGLSNDNLCNPSITNCTFIGNKSEEGGAGIFNMNYSNPTILNCLFLTNEARGLGGGLSNWDHCNPSITNCTISGNKASQGGGVSSQYLSSPTINNSIIWGNTASDGNQIYIGGETRINYSCYSNEPGDVSISGSFFPYNCINTNPRFANSGAYPYCIVGNSPCVNTGLNSYNSEPKDIRGKDRIQNITIDMGAYEWTSGTDPDGLIIYVKHDAGGSNNGTSWTDAFISFQSALNIATSGDQIWVAKGTYKPSRDYGLGRGLDPPDPRLKHFRMINGVAIYGGFAGNEPSGYDLIARNFTTNETILSGDVNGDDLVSGSGKTLSITNNSENCYHVFYHPDGLVLTNAAILDGFTITGGNADGDINFGHTFGAGICNLQNSSPKVKNCLFKHGFVSYYGGGMFNDKKSKPTVENCTFMKNYAIFQGGGIFNHDNSTSNYLNCTVADNYAGVHGGGICDYFGSSSEFKNMTVTNNYAGFSSGAFHIYQSNSSIINCTVTGNGTDAIINSKGGGFYIYSSSITISNTIVYNNYASVSNQIQSDATTNIQYSCIPNNNNDIGGTVNQTNCIHTDPLLGPLQDNGGLTKTCAIPYTSPCRDAGTTTGSSITDQRGYQRWGKTDMGAYEYQYTLQDGLVAYYPFNSNANDESGNNNNGTVHGAALTTDRFDCPNKAYSFDGLRSNDYIGIDGTGSSFEFGTGDFSMDLWVKFNSLDWETVLIDDMGIDVHPTEKQGLSLTHCGDPTKQIMIDFNSIGLSADIPDVVIDTWYNLSIIRHNGWVSIYINNQFRSKGYIPNDASNYGHELTIGGRNGSINFMDGKIDEVRIYNRALSESEIEQLYNMGSECVEPPYKEKLALWLDASEPKKFEVPPVEAESFFDIWYDMAPLPAAEDASITEEPNRMPRWLQNGINSKPAVLFETDYSATGYGNSDILASPNDAGVHNEITTGETNRWNPDSREKSYILLFQTGSTVDAEGSPKPSYYSDGRQCIFEAGGPLSGMNTYISEGKICIGAWNRFQQKYTILDPGGDFYGANTGIVYYVRYSYDPMDRRIKSCVGAYNTEDPDATSLSTIMIDNFSGLTRDDTNPLTLNDKTGIGGACRTRYHDYSTGETYSDHFNGMIGEILLYNYNIQDADILPYIDAKFGTNFATAPILPKSGNWIVIDQTESLEELKLSSAYPNPFSDWTSFGLNLPESQNIRADLFDVYGNKIMSVYSGNLSKGIHNFNIDGKDLSSGMYILRVIGDNLLVEGKVILMK